VQGHRLDINEEPAEQLGGRRRYNEDEGAGRQDNQVIRDQRAEEGEGHEDVRKYEAGTKQTDILQAETEGVKDYEKQIAIVTSYTASCLTLSALVLSSFSGSVLPAFALSHPGFLLAFRRLSGIVTEYKDR
jgi:hypothetical protein